MSEKLIAYLFPFLKFDKLLLCNFQRTFHILRCDGDKEIRTPDPLLARQVLSQLSYTPMIGLNGLEPSTSRLSGVRSNQLSYKPISKVKDLLSTKFNFASLRFEKRLVLNSILA